MNGCIIVLCDSGSSYYVLYGIMCHYVFIMYIMYYATLGQGRAPGMCGHLKKEDDNKLH